MRCDTLPPLPDIPPDFPKTTKSVIDDIFQSVVHALDHTKSCDDNDCIVVDLPPPKKRRKHRHYKMYLKRWFWAIKNDMGLSTNQTSKFVIKHLGESFGTDLAEGTVRGWARFDPARENTGNLAPL